MTETTLPHRGRNQESRPGASHASWQSSIDHFPKRSRSGTERGFGRRTPRGIERRFDLTLGRERALEQHFVGRFDSRGPVHPASGVENPRLTRDLSRSIDGSQQFCPICVVLAPALRQDLDEVRPENAPEQHL